MVKNENCLMLLKSLGVNYPLIHVCGIRFTKPLMLFVDRGQIQNAVKILSNFGVCVINEFMKRSEIEVHLESLNSEYAVFPFSGSKKAVGVLEYLCSFMKQAGIQKNRSAVLPLIISECGYVEDNQSDLFFIHLEGDLSQYQVPLHVVVPKGGQFSIVMKKMNDILKNGMCPEQKALLFSACFLYPYLVETGQENRFPDFLNTASSMVEQDENSHVLDDIREVFIDALYIWQAKEKFNEIYLLPNLGQHIIRHLDKVLLFNEKYIFIAESIFRAICKPMLETISINAIKAGLVESEILIPENKNTYSAKFGYYDYTGHLKRARALRFDKKNLSRAGDMDFITTCISTRRKK